MVAWEQNRTEYNSINPHIILRKIRCILYSNLVLSNHTARIYPSFVVLKHFISKLFCLIWYYILLIWYNQLNSCIFVFYQSNVETKWCCAPSWFLLVELTGWCCSIPGGQILSVQNGPVIPLLIDAIIILCPKACSRYNSSESKKKSQSFIAFGTKGEESKITYWMFLYFTVSGFYSSR